MEPRKFFVGRAVGMLVIIALVLGWYLLFSPNRVLAPGAGSGEEVVCTADAMQCPDGTWVGRTGPDCEFVCQ
jgi:hypothetical protein